MVGELLQFPRLKSKDLEGLTPAALVGGSGSWPNDCESKSSCKGLVTPGVIQKRYSLPDPSLANSTNVGLAYGAKNNGMAVAEFQGQYYKESDLTAFGNACHRDVKVDKTIGGNRGTAGIEAELDIEYIKAVAPEIPLTVIYASECRFRTPRFCIPNVCSSRYRFFFLLFFFLSFSFNLLLRVDMTRTHTRSCRFSP